MGSTELGVAVSIEDEELDNEVDIDAAAEVATDRTLDATIVALAITGLAEPFSMASTTASLTTLTVALLTLTGDDEGKKRVQKNAIRKLLSIRRCLRINSTTRTKKRRAAKMSMRSSQSDFSRAVMRCLEVTIRLSRTSCVEEVDLSAAVD